MQLDQLDKLANETFAGRVVRKDLVRQVKVGANVPVYVLEFLLGKYCASDDPFAIETGLMVVNQTLKDNFIRPDESELAKARVKQRGEFRLIDKVDVRLLASEDKFWAHLQNFNDKYVHIPENLVYRYDRLLQGGAWCQLDLVYNAIDDEVQKRPFYIRGLKPIQVAAFDLDEFVDARRQFSRSAWLDLVIRTIGLEPREYDLRGKLLSLCRLLPMAERNFNLIELGPWGTGKSFVYRESNPNAILISGGKVTVAQLFVNLSTGRVGLLGTWDTVAFDEVAGLRRQGHGRPTLREPIDRTSRAARDLGHCRLRRSCRPEDVRRNGGQHAQGLHGVRLIRPREGRGPRRSVGRSHWEHKPTAQRPREDSPPVRRPSRTDDRCGVP